jgi:hypothetical protein
MNLPYDILFNICAFLNYRDLIRYCSINKQYYADCKKKDSFYKKQLTEFEKYMCPLILLDREKYDIVISYLYKLNEHIHGIGVNNTNDILESLNKYLQENNILDKTKIMPYIDNKIIESYYSFNKLKNNEYYCSFNLQSNILLYTDIITENTMFDTYFKDVRIEIGGSVCYSTNEYIKLMDDKKNIYRLCWNINNINSNINCDKNMLWIAKSSACYHETKMIINYTVNIDDCTLREIGIKHEQVLYKNLSHHPLIRPHVSYFKGVACFDIDTYLSGMMAQFISHFSTLKY